MQKKKLKKRILCIKDNKYKLNKIYIQKKLPKNEELILLFVDNLKNKNNVLAKSNIFIIYI